MPALAHVDGFGFEWVGRLDVQQALRRAVMQLSSAIRCAARRAVDRSCVGAGQHTAWRSCRWREIDRALLGIVRCAAR